MSTADHRRLRLAELIRLHFEDKQANFVAATEQNQGEISGILGGKKSFGEKKARKLEERAATLPGSLDLPLGSPFYPPEEGSSTVSPSTYNGLSKASPATPLVYPADISKFRRIYVVGRATGGLPDRIWTDGDYPVGATDQYAEMASPDPQAFLTPVVGTSMVPRFNPGEFALVEPGTEPEIEDDVLVRLESGETIIKRLLSRRHGVRLGSYNGTEILTYEQDQITWIYYIAHPVPARKIKTRL